MAKKLITRAIPACNEAKNLPLLYARLCTVLAPLEASFNFEIIFLDNASTDSTRDVARDIVNRDPRFRYVRYSRNFGFEASLLAGLDLSRGDAAISLVSDLQDPPELIPDMLVKWSHGFDVVYGQVRQRNDSSRLKTLGAHMAYKLIERLTECKIKANATDYRLLDRRVITALQQMREPHRYMRGLVHWVGYKSIGIPYDRSPRERGDSHGNIYYCIKFAFHAIFCFSAKPLHFATWFGLCITVTSSLLALLYLVLYFVNFHIFTPPPPGITTLFLLVLFSIGFNSLFLGIIGEYVGRIFEQGKTRPIYLITEDHKNNALNAAPAVSVQNLQTIADCTLHAHPRLPE
jgi:dolichol-phosphate mannosyltransferase